MVLTPIVAHANMWETISWWFYNHGFGHIF